MAQTSGLSDQSLKLSSTATSDASNEADRHPSIETRVCLVGATAQNDDLKNKLTDLKIPYIVSEDGKEYLEDDDPYYETVFIMKDFEGELFDELRQTDIRILGPPVISSVAETNKPLPYTTRPLFCTCMQGLNLCFTNFKTKDHLAHLVTLCHFMGACIKKEMSSKIDFLVTNSLHGPKYRTAVSLGTPVMKEEWIHKCWAARHREKTYKSTDDEFLAPCKSKPFEGCTISFLGFSDHEKKHMEEQALQQGGSVCDVGSSSCSHLVVDENVVKSLPFEPEGRIYIVVQEWFWGSIQIEAKAAESMYIFELVEQPKVLTRSSTTSSLLGTPKWRGSAGAMSTRSRGSTGKASFSRKRSRLREETLAKLAQESEIDSSHPPRKRPSTDTSACLPDSMLDFSSNTATSSIKSPATPDVFRAVRMSTRSQHRRQSDFSRSLIRHSSSCSDFSRAYPKGTSPVLLCHLNDLEKNSTKSLGFEEELKNKVEVMQKKTKSTNLLEADQCLDICEDHRKSRKRKSSDLNLEEGLKDGDESNNKDRLKIPSGSPPSKRKSSAVSEVSSQNKDLRLITKQKRRFSLSSDVFGLNIAAPTVFRRLSLLPGSKNKISLGKLDEKVEEEDELEGSDIEDDEDFIEAEVDKAADKITSSKPVGSARYQVVMEFLQTEKNYVGILQTIVKLFKTPLDNPIQVGGPILASEDIKAIFGSLPEIEVVHRSMRDDLQSAIDGWSDSSCIGKLVLKYADDFGRCYPPFVNFFEASVEAISRCEAKSSRFHAFLKINQAKKECGRQTLAELLINPVQRLPRIILLLQDVKKHTERENSSHQDIVEIESSIEALKEVLTHINEDKRKTESQIQIFDIVYEVEGCPPTVVSSHRQFFGRAELIAVDDNLCKRGDHISLFIFSDCVEVAKRRRGVKSNSYKSPNVHARNQNSNKPLKHIKLMSLLHIKKVVDIQDSEDCENALSLYCRTPTDTQDWLYTFKVLTCSDVGSAQEDKENKENSSNQSNAKCQLLQMIARHRANTVCKASDDNFVCSIKSNELDVATADLGSTLGRAVRAAKKSSRKLTRAFSFSRTPRRVVQRAVTNMLSPSQAKNSVLALTESTMSNDADMEVDDAAGQSSTLTPSMSVASLCTPQRDRRGKRLPSSSSLQSSEILDECFPPSTLTSSVSTLNLARPQTAADLMDFPAIPTPPARKRKVGSTIKAATVALGRTGSFRRRRKYESAV